MRQAAKAQQSTTTEVSYFQAHLRRCPVIAILRGLPPAAAATTAQTLWDVGVDLIEVTVQDDDGLRTLEFVAKIAAENDRPLGAGSVTSVADLHRVIGLGAAFAISPGLDIELVGQATESGIPYLPAVATPTEVQLAQTHGVSELKLFPAREVGGTRFLAAMSGPFPGVSFIPTGGVTIAEIERYLDAGALGIGLGTELVQPKGVDLLRKWLTERRESQ
ncbi:bifunctional 4-hydroxy-2-oxoglutarate aldolase/2-dehydro-3-deoxy-phosphogluconate aldolase [Candidatus Poriferisocius sp.]|uniref:bifunctional 4-hydroxy-2-oxoglutarate aldolase/2-dehydro-3-deoxy-phosphogluconate aldolase n=1 Tax=Candidatus Poriferisocius sp. TaxID=3101276 RepID=UPI003B5B18D0